MNAKKDAEYREQAEFCREMASRSPSAERKAEWLRLANLWLSLSQLGSAGSGHADPVLRAIIKRSWDKDAE